MILTCPACGTQYVVKEGAIPAGGRQVRCAACGHSWRQGPEEATVGTASQESQDLASSPFASEPADVQEASDERPREEWAPGAAAPADEPAAPPHGPEPLAGPPIPAPAPPAPEPPATPETPADDAHWSERGGDAENFISFADQEPPARRRRGIILFVVALLLIAAIVAAIWMLAPAEWRERLGLASASSTQLQLMMTHSDRQPLASGNELLAVSGRVINPTDKVQDVPPIRAELRNSAGRLVYSWTIPPPARTLPPGGSASFNSAELDVPAGGDELTVTLGPPRA